MDVCKVVRRGLLLILCKIQSEYMRNVQRNKDFSKEYLEKWLTPRKWLIIPTLIFS